MRPYAILAAAAALLFTAGCASDRADRADRTPTRQAAGTVSLSSAPASNPAVRTGNRPVPTSAATSTPSSNPPASATTTPAAATERIVRRPVTARGQVAAGYTAVADPAVLSFDCAGSAYPSPPAVDAGVVGCGPSATYTPACWNGPTTTTAYCYRDPWQHRLARISTTGRLPVRKPPAQPSPLGLVLGDGTRCTLRIGGAWSSLDSDPNMDATYGCQSRDAIWASGRSDGIDRTSPVWKVQLAPANGHGKLRPMTVRTAYFVGTARS